MKKRIRVFIALSLVAIFLLVLTFIFSKNDADPFSKKHLPLLKKYQEVLQKRGYVRDDVTGNFFDPESLAWKTIQSLQAEGKDGPLIDIPGYFSLKLDDGTLKKIKIVSVFNEKHLVFLSLRHPAFQNLKKGLLDFYQNATDDEAQKFGDKIKVSCNVTMEEEVFIEEIGKTVSMNTRLVDGVYKNCPHSFQDNLYRMGLKKIAPSIKKAHSSLYETGLIISLSRPTWELIGGHLSKNGLVGGIWSNSKHFIRYYPFYFSSGRELKYRPIPSKKERDLLLQLSSGGTQTERIQKAMKQIIKNFETTNYQ